MNIYELIEKSNSFAELRDNKVLPDPYDDSGFYYVYYAQADYKTVLPEIMGYIDNGLRIYYNRYYDRSNSFISDYLAKVKSVHCRCAVIYLSEAALNDPVFYRLLRIILETGCNYLSINLPIDGMILSGEQIADKYVADPERASLIKELFKNEITYIPSTFSLSQKIEELNRAFRSAPMHYSLCGDFAVADYVYDLQENNIIIPQSVVIGGKEYIVKAVRRGAFANCENLKKIVFPDTVKYIGFLGVEGNLPSINDADLDEEDVFTAQSQINETNGTFYRCKSLEEIIFPPKVKILYQHEFCGCSALKRMILNDCLKFYILDNYAMDYNFFEFGELYNEVDPFNEDDEVEMSEQDDGQTKDDTILLEELHVPPSVYKIDDGQFKVCVEGANYGWVEIELPAKKVDGYSVAQTQISGFLDTQTFNLPDISHLIRIEYDNEWKMTSKIAGEYRNCTTLTEAILPDSVESLTDTFSGCMSLKSVKLPKNLKHISNAFDDCTSLTQVELPEGFASIDSGGFMNTALEEIRLSQQVLCVDKDAFFGCESLHTVISDSKYNKWLFKHKKNHMIQLIQYKHKWIYFLKLFLAYVTFPFLHPITFISVLIHHKALKEERLRFFEVCPINKIYIKEGTGNFKIKGYQKFPSDKRGYKKYIRREKN